jgi:hypothetical protein
VRGRARRGVRGPLNRKPSTRRVDDPSAACGGPCSTRCAALMVGSYATRSREPGQARKGAAVSGVPSAPQGRPAGAGGRERGGHSGVQDGSHGHFFYGSVNHGRNSLRSEGESERSPEFIGGKSRFIEPGGGPGPARPGWCRGGSHPDRRVGHPD